MGSKNQDGKATKTVQPVRSSSRIKNVVKYIESHDEDSDDSELIDVSQHDNWEPQTKGKFEGVLRRRQAKETGETNVNQDSASSDDQIEDTYSNDEFSEDSYDSDDYEKKQKKQKRARKLKRQRAIQLAEAIKMQEFLDATTIDAVMDFKKSDDPADNGALLFLIKWKAKSHMHNTWRMESTLQECRGYKKLQNYIRAIVPLYNVEADGIGAEEKETIAIELELHRRLLEEYKCVEKVLAVRTAVTAPLQRGEHAAESAAQNEYLCKWRRLEYRESTWESEADISPRFQSEIDSFYSLKHSAQTPHRSRAWKHSERPKWISREQPEYVTGGQLREYQLLGVSWMLHLWSRNENGILADEMGLGKTIQTITFLNILFNEMQQYGPFLIVVPLSVIQNWHDEFKKWAPAFNIVVYIGNRDSRQLIQEHEFYNDNDSKNRHIKFNALLTSYELILKDQTILKKIRWSFLAVDEAHRLKNSASQLHEALKDFSTTNRLLITGTPLQNSVAELNSLVQFLMPEKFADLEEFELDQVHEEQIKRLHERLKPFMLRRLKKDVEKTLPNKTERILLVDLAPMQVHYYKNILKRNFDVLNKGVKHGQMSLLNIVMELKKASNHPFLFPSAEEKAMRELPRASPNETLRALIINSGKMLLLDKLLTRLKAGGHRVLIFSQMVRMLNILTDYLSLRGYKFQRLDGGVNAEMRQRAIEHFHAPDSQDFCFLLSTRAGGLGLNLTSADTVIIFDSDWNPQNDLQAMARAHRIGQKKQVNVYRFVSKSTIEEEIIERAKRKMVLEYCIIKQMDTSGRHVLGNKKSNDKFSREELTAILKFGAQDMFNRVPNTGQDDENAPTANKQQMEDLDLDEILMRAEERDKKEKEEVNTAEFLNQFQVTELGMDQLSWEDIIPEAERKQIEDDRQKQLELEKRKEEEALLMRKYNKSLNTKAGRPQRGASTSSSIAPAIDDLESKDDNASSSTRRAKRAAARAIKTDDDQTQADQKSPNLKEVKGLLRAIPKFGSIERIREIMEDAGIGEERTVDEVEEFVKQIIKVAEDSVSAEKTIDLETTSPPGVSNSTAATGTAIFCGISFNGKQLLARIAEVNCLASYFKMLKRKVDASYRFPYTTRPVSNWQSSWSTKEDSLLLVGVYRHGFGNWTRIRDDGGLGLSNKLFLEDSERSKVPRSEHLTRRAEMLIKLIMANQRQDNAAAQASASKRGTRKRDLDEVTEPSSPVKRGKRSTPSAITPMRTSARLSSNATLFKSRDEISTDAHVATRNKSTRSTTPKLATEDEELPTATIKKTKPATTIRAESGRRIRSQPKSALNNEFSESSRATTVSDESELSEIDFDDVNGEQGESSKTRKGRSSRSKTPVSKKAKLSTSTKTNQMNSRKITEFMSLANSKKTRSNDNINPHKRDEDYHDPNVHYDDSEDENISSQSAEQSVLVCKDAMRPVKDALRALRGASEAKADPSAAKGAIVQSTSESLFAIGEHIEDLIASKECVPTAKELWSYVALWLPRAQEWESVRNLYLALKKRFSAV